VLDVGNDLALVVPSAMLPVEQRMRLDGDKHLGKVAPQPDRDRRRQQRQGLRIGDEDTPFARSEPSLIVVPQFRVHQRVDASANHLGNLVQHQRRLPVSSISSDSMRVSFSG
jgi:hypothetical protein